MRSTTATLLLATALVLFAAVPAKAIKGEPATYFGGPDEEYLNWFFSTEDRYVHSYFLQAPSGDDGAAVHWKIEGDTFHLAVAARAEGWVGFGITENGGMRGADIVTFEALGEKLTDAHVLGDLAAPIPDDCQSWTLSASHVDGGFMIFEASRPLDTNDAQDRVIVDDSAMVSPTRIIAAWGDSPHVQYHGPNNRARSAVYLFKGQDVGDQLQAFRDEMEAESEGFIVIQADDFPVPETETEYIKFCFSYDYMVQQGMPVDSAKHIVGMEAIIDNVKYVHHMSIAGNNMEKWDESKDCKLFPPMEAVYLWAPGTEPYSLPKEAGFALDQGNGFQSFQVEIHYNNPWGDVGQKDNTGIRLYYTSKKRPHDMGVLTTGDPLIALKGTPIGNGLTMHSFECPSTCSVAVLQEEITITKSYLHMHKKGTAMQNEIIRNGEVIHTAKVDYFDFDQQGQFAVVEDSYKMQAGDSVRTRCYYQSDEDTEFGKSSQQEMCIFNGYYYPRQYAMGVIPFVCIIGVYYGCDSNYTEAVQLDLPEEVGRSFGISPSTCPAVTGGNTNSNTTSDSGFAFCFPGETIVETRGGPLRMKNLELGTEIKVGDDVYEPVYSFGHHSKSASAEYLQFQPSGLEITSNHMVFVNDHPVPASMVKIGDDLNGVTVTSIKSVVRAGLYAPFTPSGKLLVNGVVASSYVALQDSDVLVVGNIKTPFTYQWLAHSFQFPHRFYCQYLGDCFTERYDENGLSMWIARPFAFMQWLITQNSLVLGFAMSLFVLLAGAVYALENGYVLLGALVAAITRTRRKL